MHRIKPLMGSVYQPATSAGVQLANMAPDYSMPESPISIRPAPTQAIPGVTTTLPTVAQPTVQSLTKPGELLIPSAGGTPWYQWFIDHPLYTALIVGGAAGLIYTLTHKKKR